MRHPAAFINVIAETGTKAEAIKYLQETWDELQCARAHIAVLQEDLRQLEDKLENTHQQALYSST